MSALRQLKTLMWKNCIVRYKQEPFLLLELGVPLLLGPVYYLLMMNALPVDKAREGYLPGQQAFLTWQKLKDLVVSYCPTTVATDKLMEVIKGFGARIQGFRSARDYLHGRHRAPVLPLIVFSDIDNQTIEVPKHLRYQLLDHNFSLHFESLRRDSNSLKMFETSAIVATQKLVTEAFISYWQHENNNFSQSRELDIALQKIYQTSQLLPSPESLSKVFSTIALCSHLPISVNIVRVIVAERRVHFKEYMKLQNVSEEIYWLSWCLVGMMGYLLVDVLLLVVAAVIKQVTSLPPNTDLSVTVLLLALYAANTTSFCCLMASLFVSEATRPYVAILVVPPILYMFASATLTWMTQAVKVLLGIAVFHVAFCLSVQAVIEMEYIGELYTFSSIHRHPQGSEHLSLVSGLLLMVVNLCVNFVSMSFFNKLQPAFYADDKSLIWCFQARAQRQSEMLLEKVAKHETFLESDFTDHPPTVQLVKLTKPRLSCSLAKLGKQTIDLLCDLILLQCSQDAVIVAETTLDIHSDHITIILGPNGPDKTALIGMITGLMKPTKGRVLVYGCDVAVARTLVRENIGLCPMKDVLFNKLTCLEHLKFYHNLKGINVPDTELIDLLAGIQLAEKASIRAVKLTAYEQKLLSLAMATIGDPKVVLLDEPSRGLSLAEQQELWSFLKTLKSGRTIIVTTISVSEAEALADCTAVIVDGSVKCYGGQMFLKKTYGVGYQLTVVKRAKFPEARVTDVIAELVPTAYLMDQSEKELRYYLPYDAVIKFSKLLYTLENQFSSQEIGPIGIYTTTLDEIFTKIQQGYNPTSLVTKTHQRLDLPHKKKNYKKIKKQKLKEKMVRAKKRASVSGKHRKHKPSNVNTNAGSLSVISDDRPSNVQNIHSVDDAISETNISYINLPRSVHQQTDQGKDKKPDSPDTFLNFGDRATLSTADSMEEYAFRKKYVLSLDGSTFWEKAKALTVKSILLTRRTWTVRFLQAGIPSLLIIAGLILDLHIYYHSQSLSIWYKVEKLPLSTVFISTSMDGPDPLVNIYRNLIPRHYDIVLKRSNDTTLNAVLLELARNKSKCYVGAEFSHKYSQGIALYDFTTNHAMVISIQLLLDTVVRYLLGHDHTATSGLVSADYLTDLPDRAVCPTTTLGLSLGLVVFSVVSIGILITDRRDRRKHLLELYGVTPVLYWLSTFAWDMAVYTLLVAFIIIIFCLDKVVFIDDGRWVVLLLVLYLSAVAFLSEIYLLQRLFDVQTTGIVFILVLHVVTGVCGSYVLLLWKYTRTEPDYLTEVFAVARTVLEVISPLYSLTAAILPFPVLVSVMKSHSNARSITLSDYLGDIDLNGLTLTWARPLTVLSCQTAFYVIVILLTDSVSLQQWCATSYELVNTKLSTVSRGSGEGEDDDVLLAKEEVKTMLQGRNYGYNLVVENLRKCYGKVVAVDGTCLIITKGDCFGLLGPSGSGKSTTVRMLAGIEAVTSGNAFVKGFSIQDHLPQVRKLISYTPQHTNLYPFLTGRETLFFFGRLRGIHELHLHQEVACLLHVMTLGALADLLVQLYGTSKKRLLSVAIGLLGNPVLILLDNPSHGLDTSERQALWSVMKKVKDSESAIFFTSESVEECETVCSKMAIQVQGKLKCLGSPNHLKTKYAMGYTIILYLQAEQDRQEFTDILISYMQQEFPGSVLSEKNSQQLRFRVPHSGEKLHHTFHKLKSAKKRLHFQSYMVHETTLEQVYLSFTLGHHVKPLKLIPKKKTVTWAEGTRDVVNTIPNTFSAYQQ